MQNNLAYNESRLRDIVSKFFDIDDAQFIDAIIEKSSTLQLNGGTVLFEKGEQSDHMFFVISGRLQVMVEIEGREQVVGDISLGETVGEMALITGEPRSAKVAAIRDSVLVQISKDHFKELAKEYPMVLWNLTKLIIQRLDKSNRTKEHIKSVNNFSFVNLCKDETLLDTFIEDIVPGIQKLGTAFILSKDTAAEYFALASDQMDYSPDNHALTAWITDLEHNHDYLIMVASDDNEAWTKRCLRQADKVVLVGRPEDLKSLNPIEDKMLVGDRLITTAVQELLILHPQGTSPSNTAQLLQIRNVKRHFHVEVGNKKHLSRFLRIMSNNANGLVLAGGGAKGHAHVGILQAMEEYGIPVDHVGGTSIGSIMAGFVGLGYDAQHLFTEARDVFMSNPTPSSEYNWLPIFSLISGKKLQQLLDHYFGRVNIEDLWLPFFCISSNLSKSKMKIHDRGPLADAIRASISLPGIFPPAIQDQSLLVDGAIFNNFPVDVMVKRSVGNVIAVSLDSTDRERREVNFQELPSRSQYIISKLFGRSKEDMANVPTLMNTIIKSTLVNSNALARLWKPHIDLFFNPQVSEFGLMDWKSFDAIAAEGYEHGMAILSKRMDLDRFRKGVIASP